MEEDEEEEEEESIEYSGVNSEEDETLDQTQDVTMMGERGNADDSDTDLEQPDKDENIPKPTDPVRNDRPIVTSRWKYHEVSALMDAININRECIKFHFTGTGGGKDVKRRAWHEVAGEYNYNY